MAEGFSPAAREAFERDLGTCPSPWEGKVLKAFVDHPRATGIVVELVRWTRKQTEKYSRLRDCVFDIAESVHDVAQSAKRKCGLNRSVEQKELSKLPRAPRRIASPNPNGKFEASIDSGEASPYQEAIHYLIGSSNFDRRGYVNQFRKQFSIGERGTALVLDSLTPDDIDGCEMRVRTVDDQYEDIPYEEILAQAESPDRKVIVSLSGIQTSQYPRALHIATKLRAEAIRRGFGAKIDILFGGFHIRGEENSRKEVMDYGFTVVDGEVEDGRLGEILTDAVHDRLKPQYEWVDAEGRPRWVDLKGNPLPAPCNDEIPTRQSVVLQTARGCPFNCGFCGVKAIDGRKVRPRRVEDIRVMLEHLAGQGFTELFLADDDFYHNPNKLKILDLLIGFAERETPFSVQIQSDIRVVKGKTPDDRDIIDEEFMEKCAKAGVHSVFVGTESVDYKVLESMGKRHNIASGAEGFIDSMEAQRKAWNAHGIGVEFTCIIGNEYDRKGVGKRTAEAALRIGANVLVPFVLGVVPGSDDDKRFKADPSIADVDPDFGHRVVNRPTIRWKNPDSLTFSQVRKELDDLIRTFYRPENIPKIYISLLTLRHFVWYMIQTALGKHGLDGGLGKVWFGEKYDESDFLADSELCKVAGK